MIKKKIFYEKRRRPDFLWKKCAAGQTYRTKNKPQAGFVDLDRMGSLSYWYSMLLNFHESQLRIFFF